MSGYWVAEWLPQMIILLMSVVLLPVLAASWLSARLWSRRTIAVNCFGSSFLALLCAISALVLAGLPTTSTLTSRLAFSDSALPRSEEHTSELQSLMRISYAVFCLKKKTQYNKNDIIIHNNHIYTQDNNRNITHTTNK